MLQRLLKSIDTLNSTPNEVIVVNDGSIDQTKKFLKKWELQPHDFISIVFNNIKSLGPGAARNIGIIIYIKITDFISNHIENRKYYEYKS